MDRRSFLAAATAGLSGLAGCGSGGGSGGDVTPTSTATPTSTVTATATPTPTATATPAPPERSYQPQLLDVGIVSTWAESGDLTANAVTEVRRGQPVVVAFRYRARIPQGTVNFSEGVDVYRGEERVVRRFRHVDRYVDSGGLHTWEDAMTFESGDWPTGRLEASVAIGELQLHRTSDPMVATFELTAD
jgi:hypothetical protein